MTDAEVIVVGGGPAGAATATRLAAGGFDVLVLDRATFPREKACAEFLSPGAVSELDRLGVIGAAAAVGAWQDGMRIVSRRAAFTLRYEEGRRGLGIARPQLDRLLLERARDEGAQVREGTHVGSALLERGHVAGVRLRDGGELRARFVVAADGIHSPVARSLGLELRPAWPRRLGLVARVRGVAASRLGLMAVGAGAYCGVASVGAGETSIGLGISGGTRRAGESAEALFGRLLASLPAARDTVAGARRAGVVRGVAPLSRRVSGVAGPGFLLVGDAAGFTDPFTGEGVFKALRGAELAAEAARRALSRPDRAPTGYAAARREAFAPKERACLLLQAALAVPAVFDHCLRRASRDRVAALVAGVFGDYVPARSALRPAVVAELVRP